MVVDHQSEGDIPRGARRSRRCGGVRRSIRRACGEGACAATNKKRAGRAGRTSPFAGTAQIVARMEAVPVTLWPHNAARDRDLVRCNRESRQCMKTESHRPMLPQGALGGPVQSGDHVPPRALHRAVHAHQIADTTAIRPAAIVWRPTPRRYRHDLCSPLRPKARRSGEKRLIAQR
jgi:hypothetical protein